ncbi:IclR family transcriptional regulator [Haloechinothrix halophila]|uniref:IclR family transcriptional regulator n=1 Tax=Haloechinothrix halophila TaxID=1069073 RepID=UPI00055462B8|nr:IclR family transcriptional regulator [Haloechinothrix halophila]
MGGTEHTAAAKLVALLDALSGSDSPSREGLTVAELARSMHRDKSIVSRQLRPLVELGLVERSEDGKHSLGWRLFAIAAKAGDQRLLLLAPPVMRRLTQLVRERCHLSIRRGTDVFTILSESPQRPVEAIGWIGRTSPVNCTSSGRALLFDHTDEEIRELYAERFIPGPGPHAATNVDDLLTRLKEARRRGFALVDGEFDADLSAVGAPVRDVRGNIVAALNISAPAYRLRDRITAAGQNIAQAAAHLSRSLSSPPAAKE